MGHHHELPLTGVTELRPNQLRHHHEVSPRGSWNYVLTKMSHHYESIMGLRPNHINIIVHLSTITFHSHTNPISLLSPTTPYSIHAKLMLTQHFSPYNQISYAYSYILYLKLGIPSQTYN